MAVIQQGFPKTGADFVDENRKIQQVWLRFLISLWNRTGSSQGGSTFSSGDLKNSAAPGPQDGWLVCDGAAVSRQDFPDLFAAIGTTWGAGDGSTTFNVPNAIGRSIVGAGGAFTFGSTGGSDTVTLTVDNLAVHSHPGSSPAHTHAFTGTAHGHTVNDPTHTHTINDPGHNHTSLVAVIGGTIGPDSGVNAGNTGTSTTGITINAASTGVTVNNTTAGGTNASVAVDVVVGDTGSGTPFSVMSPYLVGTVLIKI